MDNRTRGMERKISFFISLIAGLPYLTDVFYMTRGIYFNQIHNVLWSVTAIAVFYYDRKRQKSTSIIRILCALIVITRSVDVVCTIVNSVNSISGHYDNLLEYVDVLFYMCFNFALSVIMIVFVINRVKHYGAIFVICAYCCVLKICFDAIYAAINTDIYFSFNQFINISGLRSFVFIYAGLWNPKYMKREIDKSREELLKKTNESDDTSTDEQMSIDK